MGGHSKIKVGGHCPPTLWGGTKKVGGHQEKSPPQAPIFYKKVGRQWGGTKKVGRQWGGTQKSKVGGHFSKKPKSGGALDQVPPHCLD